MSVLRAAGGWIRRGFAARELILRAADGRVRYATLSTRLQVTLAGALLCAAGWVAYSSVGVLLKNEQLSALDAELSALDVERRQAKVAYIDMLNELADYYDQFSMLAEGLGERQSGVLSLVDAARPARSDGISLRAFVDEAGEGSGQDDIESYEQGLRKLLAFSEQLGTDPDELKSRLKTSEQAITGNMAELKERLRLSEQETERVVEMRQRIARQLEEVQSRMERASDQHGTLALTLEALRQRLAEAQRNEADYSAGQSLLSSQIASLARQLDATREARATVEHELQQVSKQLVVAGSDRSQLEQQVGELTRQLEVTRTDKRELEEQVDTVQQALAAVIGQRNALHAARGELYARVGDLEERLTAIQSSQDSVVQRIVERTRDGVDSIEKTVQMTGLDVEDLLQRAGSELPGRGGPFIAAAANGEGLSQVMLASVATLDDEVERMERLQFVLRTLPLTSPVDHYSIGSLYGKRKDPFNGRLAMHEGLDLAASTGTPVLSTAPGRVVFAGWRGSYGRMVEIDHGLGIRTRYGHLRSLAVETGDEVTYRQKVGLLGSSGRSTGPHVHFEILVDGIPHDPMKFLKAGRYVFKG